MLLLFLLLSRCSYLPESFIMFLDSNIAEGERVENDFLIVGDIDEEAE